MPITTGTNAADNLVGGSGDDSLNGGAGADNLNGGSGNDTLDGGTGFDQLSGGSGGDVLIYKALDNLTGTTFTGAPSTAANFAGYDVYDGDSGAVAQSVARDTVQIWLSPADLANSAMMTEIAYVQTTWLPKQLNTNTGQAGNGVYQFQTLNLKIVQVESVEIRNQFGYADYQAPTVSVNIVDDSLNDGHDHSTVTFTFTEAIDVSSFTLSDMSALSRSVSGHACGMPRSDTSFPR